MRLVLITASLPVFLHRPASNFMRSNGLGRLGLSMPAIHLVYIMSCNVRLWLVRSAEHLLHAK
jgi:hypothetical protein